MEKIVILGGGVAALGAAYELVKNNINPIIIERSNEIGGLASSYQIKDYHIEKFYHHFFRTDSVIMDLAKELGIYDDIFWRRTRMGFYYENKLYGFTTPVDIMKFTPLSIVDRVRFGAKMLMISRRGKYSHLDNLSAKEWLIKTFGNNIYEKIFRPLLEIKFSMSMDKASAAFVYGRLHARAKSRSKNMASEELGYMKGGYNRLLTSMYNKIKDRVKFFGNSELMEVDYSKNGCKIKFMKYGKIEVIEAKNVINTLPMEVFSKIAKNFPSDLMENIRQIKYQSVICATIGFSKKLSDYYWINISSKDLPFHGVIEHTNFIPKENYDNDTIAYVFNYVSPDNKLWKMPDDEIKEIYIEGLCKMFPHLKKKDVLWFKIAKERHATPLFLQGYEKIMKDVKNLDGFYFAGSFKIYPFSRNVNNVIKTGMNAAKEIIEKSQ